MKILDFSQKTIPFPAAGKRLANIICWSRVVWVSVEAQRNNSMSETEVTRERPPRCGGKPESVLGEKGFEKLEKYEFLFGSESMEYWIPKMLERESLNIEFS